MNCPTCGKPIENGWQPTHTHQQNTALALPGQLPAPAVIAGAYRKTPFRKPELTADVLVPLVQAIVAGGLVAIITIPLMANAGGLHWYHGLYAGAVTTALAWVIRLAASKDTLYIIEEITGRDIDNDGIIGIPPAYGVNVEVRTDDRWQFADLPGHPAALVEFAAAIITQGRSFSERTATAAGLSQPEWCQLRDAFLERNWAYWKNPDRPQVGIELLKAGMAVLRQITATPPPDNTL